MPETTRAVKWYDVPAGTQPARCRGETCGKLIYFVRSPAGKLVPIDCDVPDGKRPSDTNDPAQGDLLSGTAAVFDGIGVSHFTTCADWDQFTRGAR